MVVLLPGFDGTGELFDPLEAALDLPCQRIAYGVPAAAQDYLEVAEAQIPRDRGGVLVAESFSGPIALELLLRGRRDYRALVLSATFARVPHAPVLAAFARGGGHRFGASVVRKLVAEGLGLAGQGSAEVRAQVSRVVGALDGNVVTSRIQALLHFDPRASLGLISTPSRVLCPTRDRLVPPEHSVRLASALPNAKLVRIAAPHFLLQVQPARCAQEIASVVSEIG
ncbi:MAG: alpha/beta hydrolase [Pseudomonadota bacterium]